MNIKRFCSLFKQFSFVKLLNVTVIFSMLLGSCGVPPTKEAPLEEKQFSIQGKAIVGRNDYVPPIFTHPSPVLGGRVESRDAVNVNVAAVSPANTATPMVTLQEPTPIASDEVPEPSGEPPVLSPIPFLGFEQLMNDGKGLNRSSASKLLPKEETVLNGHGLQITPSIGNQWRPNIAYNNVAHEALVVWVDDALENVSVSPHSLHGRLISSEGIPLGDEFLITDQIVDEPNSLVVKYSSISNSYVVVWVELNGSINNTSFYPKPKYNLYALALSNNGDPLSVSPNLITGEVTASGVIGDNSSIDWHDWIYQPEYPAYDLIYNSQDSEFLVTWKQPANPYTFAQKVQRLTVNGESTGSAVTVTTNSWSSVRLGYSSLSNRYIALYDRYIDTWQRDDMFARALNADLSFAGTEVDLTPIAGDQLYSNIEYMPASDTYLFTWWDGRNHLDPVTGYGFGDLRAKKISTLGVQIGAEAAVYSPPIGAGIRVNYNSTAYNPDLDQALMLNGWDEAGNFISTFVNGNVSKYVGLPITREVYDPRSAAITGVDQPKWLAVWNSGGDIYVRVVFPRTELFEGAVANDCGGEDCPNNAMSSADADIKGPINTRTGGLFYQTEDIGVPTITRELNFFRTYSSLSTDVYTTTMGYGWTSNLDTRLIFPTDPDGQANMVLFKMRTANQYPFIIKTDGTFRPAYGVVGSLVFSSNQYILTMPDQSVFTFDSVGELQTWVDAEGNTWEYTYKGNGQLEEVSADNGTRFLTLGYDSQGRITSVGDHADREITYTYDLNGDLISASSLGGGNWQYEYDSAHHLTRVIDPMGNTDEHTEYDTQGRAIRQWDGEGNLVAELTYNADGTTAITDVLSNDIIHTYDDRLTLIGTQGDAVGATEKTYDHNFRPATIADTDGDTTSLTWSVDGANLMQVIDAAGNPTDITYDSSNNPLTVVDALNHQTTYEYAGTLLTGVTDAASGETAYTYTPEGYLESVTDGEGVTTTYGYDTHGQRISMTDEFENTWEYSYDDLGRLVNTTDPLDRVTYNEYDLAGRLIRVTRSYDSNRPQNDEDEWNIVTEYEYDAAGQQTLMRDTLGRETRYVYDHAGRLIKVIDPELHETENQFDEAGRLSVTIDALQRHTYYFYDEAGRLIETRNELNGTTKTSYNPDGTVASTTDELDRTTTYTYDELNRVKWVIQPGGAYTENTYDELGNLVAVRDPLGNVTQYEYDPVGRLIKTIDPELQETESFYDRAGRLIQSVDARENHTTYEYDEAGRLEHILDQLGGTTTYEYDEMGRRTAMIDANENRTEYTYDQLDRVIEVSGPGGTVYTEYDAAGQVVSRTDANGNTVEFTYTTLSQVQTQTDGEGGTTTYGYDVIGNRVSVQDANLHTSFMEYDELNRLVLLRDASFNETRTVYDAAGQVVTTFDALSQDTNYGYNDLGMQIWVRDPLDHEVQYAYNVIGQMTSMTDANNVVTAYEYYATGQLKAVIENYQAGAEADHQTNVRTEYTYDENGNRLTIKDGNGNVSSFTYDELNRLKTEVDPLGNGWTYTYDSVGNRVSMLDPNQLTTRYDYDDANRLVGIDYPGTQADVTYEYDNGGRRIGMTDPSGITTWTYDKANRPIAITDPFETTVQYEYDPVGNRTKLQYTDVEVNYGFDPNNRLTTVSEASNITSYQYDAIGRVIELARPNGVETVYQYDESNRLLQLQHRIDETNTLASYQYEYDNVGNRIKAVENLPVLVGPTVSLTVVDSSGGLLIGKEVYAFDGDTYSGYHQMTDANGQVAITLPSGGFRFRVDVDGTQFWSGTENHCMVGHCSNLLVTIPTPVTITVNDSDGNLRADTPVYAFIGSQYTGYHGITNAEGVLMLRLPEGDYRFRADVNSTQFWSQGACSVPTCGIIPITVTLPVTVTVLDNIDMPHGGIEVYAFNNNVYSGWHATTDENGQVQMTLPEGEYRFRTDFNNTQFWSGATNHCTVPDCRAAGIAVMLPMVVTVTDTSGSPQQGIAVYAFNGTTYTGFHGTTDMDGRVNFTLPAGEYRFRADLNGTQFWSDPSSSSGQNHCSIPDCTGAQITLTSSTTIAVKDTVGTPMIGVPVYAFDDAAYTGYHSTTDANGEVGLTLPVGSYRFRADYNGTQFWSGTGNHCNIPGCSSANVTVTNSLLMTVHDTEGTPRVGVSVYAFDGTTYTGYHTTTDANGEATFTLPQGDYRFRADYNGTQFWSGAGNHCSIPGCSSASVTVTNEVSVAVADTESTPRAGVTVYAFDGTTYTGFNATTNANGEAAFTLPQGSYRFRADYNGTQFWSSAANHCDIPGCSSASVTVTNGLLVTVQDTEGTPKAGLKVYAFNGATYTGFNATTNANGQVAFTLPQGSYRFRADLNGTQFWSGTSNHCTLPGCGSAEITVTNPLAVNVRDTDGVVKPGIKVYAFNGATYTSYSGTTDASGQVILTLPVGSYRFRADLNGTQFWSGASNHCALPGCVSANVTITIPLALTVQIANGTPQSGIKVYAFNGATYTGYAATTNGNGEVAFTLPQGSYRFRADYNGTQYWSAAGNHCAVPGCLSLAVIVGPQPSATATTPPTATPTYTEIPPTPTPTEDASPSPEPTATETPIPSETPLASLFGNVSFISFAQPQPLRDAEMGTGVGLVGKYFDNFTDLNDTPLYTRLDPQVSFSLQGAAPANGVPDDFTVRWSGQVEAPTSDEYIFSVFADDWVRIWIDGEIYLDGWAPQDFWREGPTIDLVGGQKYDIQIDFRDTGGWAQMSLHWYTPAGSIEWFQPVPMQYLYPPATNTTVTVVDTDGVPQKDLTVRAFDNTTDTGINAITNINGQVSLALPAGSYRFRTDKNGAQYWSGETNHCDMPGCNQGEIEIPTQYDSVSVDEFDSPALDSAWTWTESQAGPSWSLTDEPGSFQFTIPSTGSANASLIRSDMGTGNFAIETDINAFTDESDNAWKYNSGLTVGFAANDQLLLQIYLDGSLDFYGNCDDDDWVYPAMITLPVSLRLEKAGTEYTFYYRENADPYWKYIGLCTTSSMVSYVGLYGLAYSTISDVTSSMEYFRLARAASTDVVVTTENTNGDPQEGWNISVFDGEADTGIHGITDENGHAVFALPAGSYRFRAEADDTQFWWSSEVNHCDVPGCNYVGITVPKLTSVNVSVHDGNGSLAGMTVHAFHGTTDTGYQRVTDDNGIATFLLPDGEDYRFGTEYTAPSGGNSVQFWNNLPEACNIPDCDYAEIAVATNPVTVTVVDTANSVKEGLDVYVFDEITYTGYQLVTDANGQVTFNLPDGRYRFRADLNGTQFWSGAANHCDVPGCNQVGITVTNPITVYVSTYHGLPVVGVTVTAFNGDADSGYHQVTNENGDALFTLPLDGAYRFRADYTAPGAANSVLFWDNASEACTLPDCNRAEIGVTGSPVTVTVLDTDSTPQQGLNVFAFNGNQNSGIYVTTDVNGQATFTLPNGTFRFRTDPNGVPFWSGAENHCDPNAECEPPLITVVKPVIVEVKGQSGIFYPNLPVYAFSVDSSGGQAYTGRHATTDASGRAIFQLPEGNYHFRADYDGVQFWNSPSTPSGSGENDCIVPGCGNILITLPGGFAINEPVTIDYTYDPLYRLTDADYSSGDAYTYAYDAVGNRLTQDKMQAGLSTTDTYTYDIANRLTDLNGIPYAWDANGNLLDDSINTYAYDSANHLTSFNPSTGSGQAQTDTYTYNGLGDRLSQNSINYTLDLNTGLTQVLDDGTDTYTYGLGRISQTNATTTEYFLGDALGSVRQITGGTGDVTLAQAYDPYGVVTASNGAAQSAYGYTGEAQDPSAMVYLRARYYNPISGSFLTRDPSRLESNLYSYSVGNPINRTDPSGLFSKEIIQKNMDFFDFSVKPGDWKNHSHWGFYALLRNAVNGDWIKAGQVDLIKDIPDIHWNSPQQILLLNCETIRIGSKSLQEYYDDVINRQGDPGLWWRDTAITNYELHVAGDSNVRMTPIAKYADGTDDNSTTLPFFKGISIGLAAFELNFMYDIDGNPYLGISSGLGAMVGFGYTEGYLSGGAMLSSSEIEQAISGLCLIGIEGVFFTGLNGSTICFNPVSPAGVSSVATYYAGVEVGLGIGPSAVIPLAQFGGKRDPKKGWRWAEDDRRFGVDFGDVMMINGWNEP